MHKHDTFSNYHAQNYIPHTTPWNTNWGSSEHKLCPRGRTVSRASKNTSNKQSGRVDIPTGPLSKAQKDVPERTKRRRTKEDNHVHAVIMPLLSLHAGRREFKVLCGLRKRKRRQHQIKKYAGILAREDIWFERGVKKVIYV